MIRGTHTYVAAHLERDGMFDLPICFCRPIQQATEVLERIFGLVQASVPDSYIDYC